jgi:hypothetical protein
MNVGGYPWCPPGEQVTIAKGAQKARILCKKHNSDLSILDSTAISFFEFLTTIEDCERGKKNFDSIKKEITIQGDLFERWILKYVVGAIYSGNTRAGKLTANINFVSEDIIRILYGFKPWSDDQGFYLETGKVLKISVKSVGGDFKINQENEKLLAVTVTFHGLPFTLQLFSSEKSSNELSEHDLSKTLKYRPSKITFVKKGKLYEVVFAWPSDYEIGTEANLITT